jgi:acetyltransferase
VLYWENEAEFALLISDQSQNRGLGTELLRRLVEIGREEKLRRITADILPDNIPMQKICSKLGFKLKHDPENGVVEAEIVL